MFAAAAMRRYTTKRTIPYVTKNNWKLQTPSSTDTQSPSSLQPGNESWGSLKEAPGQAYINVPREWRKIRTLPQWKRQMFALKEKFPQGWDPKRKLSREEMQHLREMKAAQPHLSLNELGNAFRISPEAARRIVKSRWEPKEAEASKLSDRWIRRGVRLDSVKAKRAEPARQQSTKTSHQTRISSNTRLGEPGSGREQARRKEHGRRRTASSQRSRKLHDPGQDIF